ncbi:MAG TPA: hypothetical protein VMV49_06900 [Candidatus Deferrimicrobium sp.]|nr:hypothetical protein [Candidatus Deferrimicrobium sp.]
MSIQQIPSDNLESYIKLRKYNLDILLQMDAYFMVSGLPKLTLVLLHSSHGNFLTLEEFNMFAHTSTG